MLTQPQIQSLFERLHARYHVPEGERRPHVKEEVEHFRALVACLLSAQSRDSNTAKAKTALFQLADTPESILALPDAEIAAAIKPCGLYNAKTRNLRRLAAAVRDRGGEIPRTRKGLMELPGIGRKCADIVLRFSFGQEAIAVDTHVHRVCNRLGLAHGKTEEQTAQQLDACAPGWAKRDGHIWLITFAKQICTARAPKCPICPLSDLCAAYQAGQMTRG
ncbi:endonuclease III domain-containing protein [Rhodovibrio salinarum]|uniref:Endonuclease III n=1 Tax=Rhodovibrio salinarum TaxID=1087 RepID=A0A934QIX6_9PROT|nr:endonuclease III [Rhodovibrio salinarum]MBK1697275.1 endonuclease III [Rhodovibrio salinarum]